MVYIWLFILWMLLMVLVIKKQIPLSRRVLPHLSLGHLLAVYYDLVVVL